MVTRLIIDEPAAGSWNMAVDEALLQWAGEAGASALRFYQWREPTLSLGYFQPLAERDRHRPSTTLPILRRATGGGAIVHDCELTYSFVLPIQNRFSHTIQSTVGLFHNALVEVLADLGIAAQLCGSSSVENSPEPFLCFQRRDALDVLVGSHKVLGSAQRRHRGAVLQHGSLLLARSTYAPELQGLAEICDTGLSESPIMTTLVSLWTTRLASGLDTKFTQSEQSADERRIAREFERGRFLDEHWTRKR